MKACLLGQAHTRPYLQWNRPQNDSREWMRILGGGDVLGYQHAFQRPESIRGYDLAIVELTPATHGLPGLLKRAAPEVFVIGLVEGRVEYVVRSRAEMQGLYGFYKSAGQMDLLGVLVARTVPYYALYVDEPQRAQWLGIPYPKDWTDGQLLPMQSERRLVIDVASALESRNGIANLLVLREVQRRYPEVEGRIYYYSEEELRMVKSMGIRGEFLRPRHWRSYFRGLRQAFAILCMDDRRTWGRYALDAAAARAPFVGSALSHCGERVGVLTCDPFDTSFAVEALSRLVEERRAGKSSTHEDITRRQYRALGEYDGQSSLARLSRAMEAVGRADLAARLIETEQAVSATG